MHIFKLLSGSIAGIKYDLFNSSQTEGVFSDYLELTHVIRLYKSLDRVMVKITFHFFGTFAFNFFLISEEENAFFYSKT